MSEMQGLLNVTFTAESEGTTSAPLSPREVERIRRFFIAQYNQTAAGTVINVSWALTARADGSGQLDLTFTQVVRQRVVQSKTHIALVDDSQAVVARWETPLWQQCGTHSTNFSHPLSAQQAVLTLRPQFEIEGYPERC